MARTHGSIAAVARMQRDAARAAAARNSAQAAAMRAAAQARSAYERANAADLKARQRLYAESRAADVTSTNEELTENIAAIDRVLLDALDVDSHFDLQSLKSAPDFTGIPPAEAPLVESSFLPPAPRGVSRLLGSASRYEEQLRSGRARYQQAAADRDQREKARLVSIAEAESSARAQWEEVDKLSSDLGQGRPDALVAYIDLVLNSSIYPRGFPQQWRLAYVPDSRQLVIEYELPSIVVIPTVKAYRYTKATDTITDTPRPQSHVRAQYGSLIAQVALRVVHELFEADRLGHIESVVLNGMVSTTNPATGQKIRPCLLTLRTTRGTFEELDLGRVDPAACLKHLGAGVSQSPTELTPVRPVLDFNMVDPRFVEETDVMSGLDERPNLLAMSPTEFESLVQNLFTKMGLDTRQTRASRDGGVDCVAFDPRPIMGGKVVIQAKRYKNTVGVSAVRDLFGTLQNEGASKGILVTTSGYGKASFEFATGKPIELLDGANLLYLLRQHAGVEARIEVPQEWRDPEPDSPSLHNEDLPNTLTDESALPTVLQPGQVVEIEAERLRVLMTWPGRGADLDLSALLLGTDGRVASDADFIFYNQPSSTDNAVRHLGKNQGDVSTSDEAEIDVRALSPDVAKVAICASVDGATFAEIGYFQIAIDLDGGVARYSFSPGAEKETALVCIEVYRRSGHWRIRAVGQGYLDGLAGLARDFGVNVD